MNSKLPVVSANDAIKAFEKIGLLRSLINNAGLSIEEFKKLL